MERRTLLKAGLAPTVGHHVPPDGSALVGERDSGRVHRAGRNGGRRPVGRVAVHSQRASSGEGGGLGTPQVVLAGIPTNVHHNGGRLAFHGGLLFASTGDAENGSLAQDRGSLAGKILRGSPATARAGCGPASSAREA